jgi:cell division protease FtsH
MTGGVTWFLPKEDSTLLIKSKIEDDIASMLGGYCAEELIFGEVSSGASNDLKKATELARHMVTKWGMSDTIGPVAFNNSDHNVFLGKEISEAKNYSEGTARVIDEEISAVLKKAHGRTKELLKKHQKLLTKIAEELLKKESLTEKEFLALIE